MKLLRLFWEEVKKEMQGKLFAAPAVLYPIISGAVTLGSKFLADQRAKKQAKELDKQAAIEKEKEEKKAMETVAVARGIAKRGDPTLATKVRETRQTAADATGRVRSTTGSTQEVIKALTTIQKNQDSALAQAYDQDALAKREGAKFLAERYTAAGQQRLQANQLIDQRMARNLEAIGANAQATVDTFQNIGKQFQDIGLFGGNKPYANYQGIPEPTLG